MAGRSLTLGELRAIRFKQIPKARRREVLESIGQALGGSLVNHPGVERRVLLKMAATHCMNNFQCHFPGGMYRGAAEHSGVQKKLDEIAGRQKFDSGKWRKEFEEKLEGRRAVINRIFEGGKQATPGELSEMELKYFEAWPLFLEMLKHFELKEISR